MVVCRVVERPLGELAPIRFTWIINDARSAISKPPCLYAQQSTSVVDPIDSMGEAHRHLKDWHDLINRCGGCGFLLIPKMKDADCRRCFSICANGLDRKGQAFEQITVCRRRDPQFLEFE